MGLLDRVLGTPKKHGETKRIREMRAATPEREPETARPKQSMPPTPSQGPALEQGPPPPGDEPVDDMSDMGEMISAELTQGAAEFRGLPEHMPEDMRQAMWRAHQLTNIARITGASKDFLDLAHIAWDEVDELGEVYGLGRIPKR